MRQEGHMRISIIGGGPAGLYFAILMQKADPGAEIDVYERNRADDTFGFGVVFSDESLDTFEAYDQESYRKLASTFAYWDDIEIHRKGDVQRIGGNGFCGCSRRELLLLMQERARSLGVRLHFESDVTLADLPESDLVVAADGINSAVRQGFVEHFQPTVDLRPNYFAWMGSTRPLDAFSFFFEETEHGIFIAHAYQYARDASTWIFECQPATFERASLSDLDEAQSAARMAEIFAEALDGHPLIINRSMWRNFPMIRTKRWVKDNVVLLGDAKATAHFSIGSGTKRAIEDAIALFESFQTHPNVADALSDFENSRRDEVERTQHAADVSLVWFEHVDRFWTMDPVQFAFGLMTRSKAITWDNLELRAPEFIGKTAAMFERQVKARGLQPNRGAPPAFQPFALRDLRLENRLVVSPMCMYSARDGTPNDWHMVHYGARAVGGAGLLFTEMTDITADARISLGCTGIYDDGHEVAWRRIVDFVHANSRAKICLQLGHAGQKGATKLMWEGMDEPLEDGAWPIVSASPLPYFPHSQVPRELTCADMDEIVDAYVAAAERAERAGFDMLELHCAHGYLLASFISPLTNIRSDEFGGSLENRLRFPLRVFQAIRDTWPKERPMSVRISATDWKDGGVTGDDAVAIARAFAEHGADLIDVSTGQTVHDSAPVFGRMFQTPFADQIRNATGLATMCVGNITTADQANTILAAGRADLVALARPHLSTPSFALDAAAQYGFEPVHCPPQYLPGKDQLMRNWARQREDLRELRLKARPRRHG
jgi:anthraniloyl-CoA monooxygenase